jgi:hypothetical protein
MLWRLEKKLAASKKTEPSVGKKSLCACAKLGLAATLRQPYLRARKATLPTGIKAPHHRRSMSAADGPPFI